MEKGIEFDFYAELDKIAERTKLTDAMLSSQIMNWGRKRGLRISDEVAVAYRFGYLEGKKSNEERVARAYAKIYPVKKKAPEDVIAAVEAVSDPDPDTMVNVDVTTPDGNAEVE